MVILVTFLIGVFTLSAWNDLRQGPLRLRWLMVATLLVSLSFYSLRVIE